MKLILKICLVATIISSLIYVSKKIQPVPTDNRQILTQALLQANIAVVHQVLTRQLEDTTKILTKSNILLAAEVARLKAIMPNGKPTGTIQTQSNGVALVPVAVGSPLQLKLDGIIMEQDGILVFIGVMSAVSDGKIVMQNTVDVQSTLQLKQTKKYNYTFSVLGGIGLDGMSIGAMMQKDFNLLSMPLVYGLGALVNVQVPANSVLFGSLGVQF